MQKSQIMKGVVYTNNTTQNRRVLALVEGEGGTRVRYQAIDWDMKPEDYLKRYDHLTPMPTLAQLRTKQRIAPGVLYAETSLESFAKWAKQVRELSPKFPVGRTMASHVIEVVMRNQYTSLSAERAFYDVCSMREHYLTNGPCCMPWIYTMPDGSRIAFMAPVLMAEIDDTGAPILATHHQLDLEQSFAFGDIERIKSAEFKVWIEANRPCA